MTEASFLQRVLDECGANAWANLQGLRCVLSLPPLRDPVSRKFIMRPAALVEVEHGRFERVQEVALDLETFHVVLRAARESWSCAPGALGVWRMDGYYSIPTGAAAGAAP